jgi:lysophospholipase L1-like esterase
MINKVINFRSTSIDGTKGFGELILPDNRRYIGDIFFDGHNYFALGKGKLDFHNSRANSIDENIQERMSFYEGDFDYRVAENIYGNGVMYYETIDHIPSHYVKGFFREHFIVGKYNKTFDYKQLNKLYTKDMEFYYNNRQIIVENEVRKIDDLNKIKILLIGDSYFEIYKNKNMTNISSYEVFPNSLNLGIGGRTFNDYFNTICINDVYKKIEPCTVIVNLGFNDLHLNKTVDEVFKDFIMLNELLKKLYKDSLIIYTTPIKAPLFEKFDKKINKFHEIFVKYLKENSISFIDTYSIFDKATEIDKLSYFLDDFAHPSKKGYNIYTKYLMKYIKP